MLLLYEVSQVMKLILLMKEVRFSSLVDLLFKCCFNCLMRT